MPVARARIARQGRLGYAVCMAQLGYSTVYGDAALGANVWDYAKSAYSWATAPVTTAATTAATAIAATAKSSTSTRTSRALVSGLYKGSGGYVYQWNAKTAEIRIRFSPARGPVNSVLTPGSAAYSAVLSELTWTIQKPNITEAGLLALASNPAAVAAATAATSPPAAVAALEPAAATSASTSLISTWWFPPAVVGGVLLVVLAGYGLSRKRR